MNQLADAISHRDAHEERPVLHPLQLRQQDHPRDPIEMYEVPLHASAGEGGAEEGGRGGGEGGVSGRRCLSPSKQGFVTRISRGSCCEETDLRSVNLTDDGRAALLKLSKGDMRRALNVLQVSPARLSPAIHLDW